MGVNGDSLTLRALESVFCFEKRVSRTCVRLKIKRMARPVRKQFWRSDLTSLHQRIRPLGIAPAKMEIRASRSS